MINIFSELLVKPIGRFFKNSFAQVAEINKRYAVPRIKTSKAVKLSLLMLRLYLILLVGILFFKFYTIVVK